MKILFLAANPVDVGTQLRIDQEIREIGQKIRMGPARNQLELVSEWAVRAGDLQAVLLRHKPDIVHFSGHCSPSCGIILEDDAGHRKVVSKKALADLFRILKDNLRVVVLNACYANEQALALTRTIDFTIGMNASINDRAAIVFAAHFYQSLAFDRSVKEAFELAVNQLSLEGIDATHVPELLVRDGANAAESHIGETAGHSTGFLPWLISSIAISLTVDVLRRFLGGGSGWPELAVAVIQPVLIALTAIVAAFSCISLARSNNQHLERAARSMTLKRPQRARQAGVLTAIALVLAVGSWMSLPVLARYHNERSVGFQNSNYVDPSEARESYEQPVRLLPDHAQEHFDLAIAHEDFQPEKAIEEYILAIRYDRHIHTAYNNLARLYLLRGNDHDYERALALLRKARDLSDEEDVQYSLSKNIDRDNYALKRYQFAETNLRKPIAPGPTKRRRGSLPSSVPAARTR